MKKWIIGVGAGLLVILIAALLIVFFSLNSIVKKGVETVGPRLTKVEVRLGGANLSPFSGDGQLNRLFVGNPEGYQMPSAITVEDIKVRIELPSLFSETLAVEEIRIQAPEITFEGSLSGNNLSKILANIEETTGPAKTRPEPPSTRLYYVKDLAIEGGQIHLSATMLGGKALAVALPPVHLQNIGSPEKGVTTAELSQQIMGALLANVLKAVSEALSKDLGKDAVEQLEKGTKSLKDLFKK